jgi:phenylacetate-CoA ligase
MGKIVGRSDDMLIIRGVNLFPTQIEELILKMPGLAPQYQLVVSREGHLDCLEVLCELRADLPGALAEVAQGLARELEHNIKSYTGVSARVRPLPANGIERTLTGKARRVVDKRPRAIDTVASR